MSCNNTLKELEDKYHNKCIFSFNKKSSKAKNYNELFFEYLLVFLLNNEDFRTRFIIEFIIKDFDGDYSNFNLVHEYYIDKKSRIDIQFRIKRKNENYYDYFLIELKTNKKSDPIEQIIRYYDDFKFKNSNNSNKIHNIVITPDKNYFKIKKTEKNKTNLDLIKEYSIHTLTWNEIADISRNLEVELNNNGEDLKIIKTLQEYTTERLNSKILIEELKKVFSFDEYLNNDWVNADRKEFLNCIESKLKKEFAKELKDNWFLDRKKYWIGFSKKKWAPKKNLTSGRPNLCYQIIDFEDNWGKNGQFAIEICLEHIFQQGSDEKLYYTEVNKISEILNLVNNKYIKEDNIRNLYLEPSFFIFSSDFINGIDDMIDELRKLVDETEDSLDLFWKNYMDFIEAL